MASLRQTLEYQSEKVLEETLCELADRKEKEEQRLRALEKCMQVRLSLAVAPCLSLSLTHTLSHTLSLSRSLSLTHTHTHSLALPLHLPLTHSLSPSHTHSLSISLSLPLSLSVPYRDSRHARCEAAKFVNLMNPACPHVQGYLAHK